MIGGTFVNRCALEVNGQVIDDFASVEEAAIVAGKTVPIMYGTGYAPKTKRYEITVEYVVPTGDPFEWSALTSAAGTLTIDYEDGNRVSYGGVRLLELGPAKTDGETELKQNIRLMASNRDGVYY